MQKMWWQQTKPSRIKMENRRVQNQSWDWKGKESQHLWKIYQAFRLYFFSFFFFWWDWALILQSKCSISEPHPQSILLWLFWRWLLANYLSSWPQTMILVISASQKVRVTGSWLYFISFNFHDHLVSIYTYIFIYIFL
jgi:hypothetical protein